VSDEAPKERKSIIHMSPEELKRGEWRNDPELVAEFNELMAAYNRAGIVAVESLSDEERALVKERLEDGTYEYGQDLIRAEGEM
jgi:hypothetical protein